MRILIDEWSMTIWQPFARSRLSNKLSN